jgi:hypothetical protein
MPLSTPDDLSRFELLLADIRNVFADKVDAASADLVKALVAIEGRPWAKMGKRGNPMTQKMLAWMLKSLGIGPHHIGTKTGVRGYQLWQFKEAFERYLPPEGGSEVQNAASNAPSMCYAARPEKRWQINGSERGLSGRRIQEHADWYSDQAYWHYSKDALDAGVLDAELTDDVFDTVSGAGVLPEGSR